MKEILLTSLVLITVMAVLLYINGVPVIAQETTNVGMETNNITAPDTNNMTGDDNATEPDAGIISRKG